MERKGISALIGSVLVLAVTISMVTLFSSWAPGLINTITDDTTAQTEDRMDCNRADLGIEAATYHSDENQTETIIRNKGTIELSEIQLETWNGNTPVNQTLITTSLSPGNFTSANISADSKPTSVEALSTSCSEAQHTFEDIQ